MKIDKFIIFLSTALCTGWINCAGFPLSHARLPLDSGHAGWQVKADGDSSWIEAAVPGTFFVDYVNAGLEPDPDYGDNIYRTDRTKYNRRHVYRTVFDVPGKYLKEHNAAWLNFDGINRSGIIYLNGHELGRLRGMMMRGRFDISDIVRSSGNELTVYVDVPNQKRHPEEKFANMASPAYLSSAGWDWMPNVPGLNSGITDNVWLDFTGDVTIRDPWIRTSVSDDRSYAELTVSAVLSNISGKPVETVLSIGIEPAGIHVETNVKLGPHETRTVELRPEEYPELRMQNPELWWPSGYGEPFLYDCKVSATCRGSLSDEKSLRFGVREFSYKTDGNGVFNIYVNGERIFLKGGNWGMSEYLLRCRNEEYDLKVRLHKEMNFNIIRNWMGSVTDEEFYDACDRYGILVWDDFWLNSKIGLPEFPEDFNANAIEKIKRLRNHPCIAVWCGENEGTPGTYPSGESLDENLAGFVREYDGSDRHYQSDSRKGNGLSGSGLWKNFPPEFYFARADNSTGGDKYPPGRGWGLRTEIGTAVFTTFESFKKFMPQEHWWPRNEMWNKHFFGPLAKNGGYDVYSRTIETKYGACGGIEEFCEKAQLVNLETTKAMFEAWSSKMWNDAAGIMVWMSQPAYPSFVWQTYDYYYDLTGAFWGAKKGCEPLHILWDSAADQVMAVNSTSAGYEGMTAIAMIFDRNGRQISELRNQKTIDIPAGSAVKCFDVLNDSTGCSHLTDVNFMRLSLKDKSGKTVSSNDYWFGKDRSDCTGLETLPESELAFHISRREVSSGRYFLDLKITNKGDTPAFALKCTLYDKNAGERILPAFQSADYITLMPGEIKIITFETADNPYYDNTSVFVKVKQYGHDEILVE